MQKTHPTNGRSWDDSWAADERSTDVGEDGAVPVQSGEAVSITPVYKSSRERAGTNRLGMTRTSNC